MKISEQIVQDRSFGFQFGNNGLLTIFLIVFLFVDQTPAVRCVVYIYCIPGPVPGHTEQCSHGEG